MPTTAVKGFGREDAVVWMMADSDEEAAQERMALADVELGAEGEQSVGFLLRAAVAVGLQSVMEEKVQSVGAPQGLENGLLMAGLVEVGPDVEKPEDKGL